MQAKEVVDRFSVAAHGSRLAITRERSHEGQTSPSFTRSPERRAHKALTPHTHGSMDAQVDPSHRRSGQAHGSAARVEEEDSGGGREGEHGHLTHDHHGHLTHDHHHRVAEVLDAEFLHGDDFKTPLSPAQERPALCQHAGGSPRGYLHGCLLCRRRSTYYGCTY